MTRLVRWEPFRDLADVRNVVNRSFDRGFSRPWPLLRWEPAEVQLPVDLYETDDAVTVTASLPGVKAADVSVSVTGNVLTIKGESKAEEDESDQSYYRQERRFGTVQRSIRLPVRVEADDAQATFEDGVLKLELPKAADVKAKTIEVKATNAEAKASA